MNGFMSTMRSLRTGRPRIGSTVTLGRHVLREQLAREGVATVDQHRVRTADTVRARASERQRSVLMPLDLMQDLDSGGRADHTAAVNSSHQDSWETSGLYRRIFRWQRHAAGASCGPAGPSDSFKYVRSGRHQYFLSIGMYGPIFTGL